MPRGAGAVRRDADKRIADGACMDELTLGLIGAGAVVVVGVVVYNAWQAAKVRRRLPRPMPPDAAGVAARHEHEEERPFIEPARPNVRGEPALSEAPRP